MSDELRDQDLESFVVGSEISAAFILTLCMCGRRRAHPVASPLALCSGTICISRDVTGFGHMESNYFNPCIILKITVI